MGALRWDKAVLTTTAAVATPPATLAAPEKFTSFTDMKIKWKGDFACFRLYLVVNRGWYVLRPTRSSRPATDRAEDWTPAQLAIPAMQVEVVPVQSRPGEQSKKAETIKMSLMLQL